MQRRRASACSLHVGRRSACAATGRLPLVSAMPTTASCLACPNNARIARRPSSVSYQMPPFDTAPFPFHSLKGWASRAQVGHPTQQPAASGISRHASASRCSAVQKRDTSQERRRAWNLKMVKSFSRSSSPLIQPTFFSFINANKPQRQEIDIESFIIINIIFIMHFRLPKEISVHRATLRTAFTAIVRRSPTEKV